MADRALVRRVYPRRAAARGTYAAAPTLCFAVRTSAISTAVSYLRLGAVHLAEGADHLLFVAGLFALAANGRVLLIALSGFTLAIV